MGAVRVLTVLLLTIGFVSDAGGQSISVGAAMHASFHRFDSNSAFERLDGAAPGLTVFGVARFGNWLIQGAWFREGTIRNGEQISLTVNDRPTIIYSEMVHDLRGLAILGGRNWDVTRRLQLALAFGVSIATVDRSFVSDAGERVLFPPSTVPTTPVVTTYTDRFSAPTIEGGMTVRFSDRVGLVAGAGAQPIRLRQDISGRSVRTFGGVVWRLK